MKHLDKGGADFTWSGDKFHTDDVLGSREVFFFFFFLVDDSLPVDELRRVGLDNG